MDGVQQLDELMPAARAAGRRDLARPARRPDAVRELHRDGRARAHDRRRHCLRPGVPRRAGVELARTLDADGTLHDRWQAGDGRPPRRRAQPTGPQERTIAAPFGEVPGGGVRPLRRLRRPRPRLGPGHRHRPGLRPARRPRRARSTRSPARRWRPAMRDGDTFAAETEAPADASPLERLVAFSGRQLVTDRSNTP